MDESTFVCSVCKTETHYMDTLIIGEARVCLECCSSEYQRLTAELAQARAERDAEQKRRVFAEEGEENLRFLKNLWENESGFYLRKYGELGVIVNRQRRTIRALVVAARAMDRTGGAELEGEYWYPTVRTVLHELKQSGQQAGE